MWAVKAIVVVVALASLAHGASTRRRDDQSATTNFLQAAEQTQWRRAIRHCWSVGDPHFLSFNGRRTDWIHERELNLYSNTVPYKEKLHSLTTRFDGRPATQSHIAYYAGGNYIQFGFRFKSMKLRTHPRAIDGMELYKNGVKQSRFAYRSSFRLGDIFWQWHRGGQWSKFTITNRKTGFRLSTDYIGGESYFYFPMMQMYIWANVYHATGVCTNGNFYFVNTDKSMFPTRWMENRKQYFSNGVIKAHHVALLALCKKSHKCVLKARTMCYTKHIAKRLWHDCAFDYIKAKATMKMQTVREYIKVSKMTKMTPQQARAALRKALKKALESARHCTTVAGKRYWGGGFGAGSRADRISETRPGSMKACRTACQKNKNCRQFVWYNVGKVCYLQRSPYKGSSSYSARTFTSGNCKQKRAPGHTCQLHWDCGRYRRFKQMCLYGRCALITQNVGGACYKNSHCRFGLKCSNYQCS